MAETFTPRSAVSLHWPSSPLTLVTTRSCGWVGRSFDQQWTFDDPRLINLERPALWQSLSDQQLFLVTPGTMTLGTGPAITASIGVPDLHYFRGSFGGRTSCRSTATKKRQSPTSRADFSTC
ncbi:hypothetical protein GS887_27500 [Rhodococcus hoagii]|nr:hypothetical protein [Prescottella equi]